MATKEYYFDLADKLIERDSDLREQHEGMERMVHLEYQLPEGLRTLQWMRNVRTTAPYDAYKASRRILSGLDERITFFPYSDKESDIRSANEFEHVLRWNFNRAAARKASFREDVIGSAVLYDRIVAQVVHLPTQIKNLEDMQKNTSRHKAAMRHGPFAIILHNPKNVHLVYSDYMLEQVFLHVKQTAQQIIDFWGDDASQIKEYVDNDAEKMTEPWILCDIVTHEERFVWAVRGDSVDDVQNGEQMYVLRKVPNELDFLAGWVAVTGGNAIDEKPEYQSQPLLFPIYQAEQWVTANILASLTTSQAIAEMGRPKVKKTGPGARRIRSEFGTPGGAWVIDDLQSDVTDMGDKPLDPALNEAWQRFISDMETTTLPRVLVSAEPQPGEAFAGFNLRLQTALGQLLPYKRLAERWYEGVFEQMLLWAEEWGEPLTGYKMKRKRSTGELLKINPTDIVPERMHLRVELSPDVPTDRVQRVTSAINMSERLHVPVKRVLEELGETDPEGAIREWMREQIIFAVLEGRLMEIADATSGRLQQRAMQLAQAQLQTGEGGGEGGGEIPPAPGANGREAEALSEQFGEGIMGVGGELFNPAEGNTVPAQASPEGNTREGATGTDRLGSDIANMLGLFGG